MAWTALLKGKNPQADGRTQLIVSLDDGKGRVVPAAYVTDGGVVSLSWLKQQINATTALLDAADTLQKGLTVGALIDLTPDPAPVDQTPARTLFVANWRAYQSLARAVNAGVLPPEYKPYTDLLATLQAAWDPSYVGLV